MDKEDVRLWLWRKFGLAIWRYNHGFSLKGRFLERADLLFIFGLEIG
jgi:hypothetical protein